MTCLHLRVESGFRACQVAPCRSSSERHLLVCSWTSRGSSAVRRRTSGTTVTTWYLRVDSTRLSPVCRPSSMRSRLSKYRGSVRVYRVYSTAAVLKCLLHTLALILIQSMSVWMHQSTLQHHSCPSRAATSTSSQVSPTLCKNCRFFLSVPFQFDLGWPRPLRFL